MYEYMHIYIYTYINVYVCIRKKTMKHNVRRRNKCHEAQRPEAERNYVMKHNIQRRNTNTEV